MEIPVPFNKILKNKHQTYTSNNQMKKFFPVGLRYTIGNLKVC